MKAISFLALPTLLLVMGCNDSQSPADAGNPMSAPTDYLNNTIQAENRAVKTVDAATINKVIDSFYVQEGRFPKSLSELEDKAYLPKIPDLPNGWTWDYDTNNGIASIKKD